MKKSSKYNTRLSFMRETIVIICHLVASPFKAGGGGDYVLVVKFMGGGGLCPRIQK